MNYKEVKITSCENCIRFKCPYDNKTKFYIGKCTSKIELKHKDVQ